MNKKGENPGSLRAIPWADRGGFGEDMMIVGNREGLLAIRAAIDTALDKQEAYIEESEIEFGKVLLVDQARPPETQAVDDKWLIAGCLLLAAVACLIFLFGLVEIARNLL